MGSEIFPTSDQPLHHAGTPRKYGLSVSSKKSTTLATVVPPGPDCLFSCSHPSPSRAIVQELRKQSPISPASDKKGFDPAREVEGAKVKYFAVAGQDTISVLQHLKTLRQTGLVEACQEGKFLIYSLSRSDLSEELVLQSKVIAGA